MEKIRLGPSMQTKKSVIGGSRNRKHKAKSVVPTAGHLVALRGLLRKTWVDAMVSLTAFSGHAVPGPGMGSRSSHACGGFIRLYISVADTSQVFCFSWLPYPASNWA